MPIRHSIGILPPLPEVEGVEFRHIDGFPGYCVGDDGSIWSWRIPRTKWRFAKQPRRINLQKHTNGYRQVMLSRRGVKHLFTVHQLVLEAFVGRCPPEMECRHFPDPDKTNGTDILGSLFQ